jgi:hypothetical protein
VASLLPKQTIILTVWAQESGCDLKADSHTEIFVVGSVAVRRGGICVWEWWTSLWEKEQDQLCVGMNRNWDRDPHGQCRQGHSQLGLPSAREDCFGLIGFSPLEASEIFGGSASAPGMFPTQQVQWWSTGEGHLVTRVHRHCTQEWLEGGTF